LPAIRASPKIALIENSGLLWQLSCTPHGNEYDTDPYMSANTLCHVYKLYSSVVDLHFLILTMPLQRPDSRQVEQLSTSVQYHALLAGPQL